MLFVLALFVFLGTNLAEIPRDTFFDNAVKHDESLINATCASDIPDSFQTFINNNREVLRSVREWVTPEGAVHFCSHFTHSFLFAVYANSITMYGLVDALERINVPVGQSFEKGVS